jgi:5-enolpyruvylshikimate-3-phosphate synthase
MSFAVAGLVCEGIEIRGASCVSKSYPCFFDDLARLGGRPAHRP